MNWKGEMPVRSTRLMCLLHTINHVVYTQNITELGGMTKKLSHLVCLIPPYSVTLTERFFLKVQLKKDPENLYVLLQYELFILPSICFKITFI